MEVYIPKKKTHIVRQMWTMIVLLSVTVCLLTFNQVILIVQVNSLTKNVSGLLNVLSNYFGTQANYLKLVQLYKEAEAAYGEDLQEEAPQLSAVQTS